MEFDPYAGLHHSQVSAVLEGSATHLRLLCYLAQPCREIGHGNTPPHATHDMYPVTISSCGLDPTCIVISGFERLGRSAEVWSGGRALGLLGQSESYGARVGLSCTNCGRWRSIVT